uniref:Rhomboid domain-containing protein n=1 Tax=Macrostomum lignano TaxID=282301 RepID=A0A1I8F1W4_9PLAT
MHRHHYNFSRAALSLIGFNNRRRRLLTVLLSLPRPPSLQPGRRYFNVNKSAVSDARQPLTNAQDFARAFLAPYRLTGSARRLAWRGRAFWALVASGTAYGICRLWETHQAKKSDPNSLYLPFMGVQPGLSRWSLLGPYAVVLMLSSCVPPPAAAAAAAAGSRISLLGAENFLRLFADKPGLGPTVRAFSRPLLSPLGSALSHRTVGHFLASQLVLFGALTSCIGKMSPGEFVAFSVAAAYATSLASVLAMTLANRLGASGVLSALVAYNALTADQNVQLGQQQESGSSSPSSLALLGVIPLPWLTPAVGLSVWAGVEAVSWMVTVWRGRLPRLNHPAHPGWHRVRLHRKFSHLSNISSCCYADLPLPLLPQPALARLSQRLPPLLRPSRRCLKASPRPSPNGQQQQQRGQPKPKLFFRRIGQLAESPVSTEPLSLSAGGHAFQLAARAVAALAVGGLVSVMVSERRNRHRRDCASQLSQYDLGYVGIQEDDGLDK